MPKTRLFALLLALLAVPSAAHLAFTSAQQANSGFTVEQVLSAPFPSDLIAAPTGERLAWVFNAEGKRNLWGAEGPDFKARQLTPYNADDGQELTNLGFTRDGKWIVYVRGGDENQAGEVPNPTSDPNGTEQAIFAVNFDDKRVVRVADGTDPVVSPVDERVVFQRGNLLWINLIGEDVKKAQPVFIARGNNSSPQWSGDGKQLAFVSTRGDHSFIGIYDFATEKLRYLAPTIDRDSYPRWSGDGKRIAFVRQPTRGLRQRSLLEDQPDPWAIWVADVWTGKAKEVWRSGNKLEDSLPRMAGANLLQWAAGERLVFASEQDGWLHLYSITTNGGAAKLLTPGKCEVEHITLAPDKTQAFYSSNCEQIDQRHLWRVSLAEALPQAIGSGAGNSWSPTITGNGKSLSFIHASATSPGEITIVSPPNGIANLSRQQTVSQVRLRLPFPLADLKNFPADRLVIPQQAIFKAADDLEIHGQLFLPKDAKPGDKLPAVIFAHGGPVRQMLLGWHYMYYYHNTYAFNQYLASKGYAVLSVNFRSGIGYGRAFREAPKRGARGASEYQDIVAAANYLRARPDIDTGRIGLWGGSYGGYLTALGLARNSDLFACGVDIHGVHDWSTRISGANWIEYGNRDAAKIAFEASPMSAVEKWRAPVLLIHGDDDRNVAFSQTTELARRLREQKVEFEQLVFPDEVHDFLLHRHWVEIFNTAFDFFERRLKNRPAAQSRVSQADLLLRGGRVLDGTGAAERIGDVAISGDRISFIGDAAKAGVTAQRTIDAAGLIVAPGFIDPHTHTAEYLSRPEYKSNENFLLQGVTTVITGNDGGGPFPIGETLDKWQQQGIGTNAALFVGHGTVRRLAMGAADAAPTAAQLEKMKSLVSQAMDEGAFGLSTGLYYAPGSFAKTEEVIELAKVVAARGGIYDTHMRDESSYNIGLLGSIEEVIHIGREARLPVHISHIKALGTDVWGQSGKAIELINRARAAGINVTANQYPYTASGTGLTAALVPRWAEDGGNAQLLKRIADPAVRPRLVAEMEKNLKRRGGANSLLIISARDKSLVGKRLDAIAQARGKTPVETALEIIKAGGAGVASFNMNEQDIENFMKQSWVMTGSDGGRSGHPRGFGTYPRKIREYVFKRKIITLPRMIQASSWQVAETLKLKARGKLAEGWLADVIVFDDETIAERATYEQPEALAMGMKYVLVNGKLAVDGGKYTGALAGRALRKSANNE